MAVSEAGPIILDDVEFVWNAVDLSDHVQSVAVQLDVDEADVSAMGDTWKEWLVGVPMGQVTVTFLQDYYTSEVDATLRSDFTSRTKRTMTIMPDKTAGIGATNAQASCSAFITSYPWLDGAFNEALTADVTIRVTGAITWSTS